MVFSCSLGILSLTVLSFAQQVVVRSPNGLERLKKGDMVSIDWGCVQCSGTTELHLVRVPTTPTSTMPSRTGYQEIGVIKASIPVTPAQQFYSYNWRVGDYYGGTAQLGGGYKILVKIVTPAKTVSDLSDSGFVIGAVPTIDYFAINDGLAVTNQRKVTLNYRITGFPSPGGFRVRCTPKPGTVKDAPLAAGTWPTYELPAEPGDYTIELSLMNDLGTGPSKTDTIRYELPPPPQKDFTVKPSSLDLRVTADSGLVPIGPMRLTSSTLPPESHGRNLRSPWKGPFVSMWTAILWATNWSTSSSSADSSIPDGRSYRWPTRMSSARIRRDPPS